LTCTAVYTTDANGVVTFGVISDTPGSMNVQAGVDVNQNGGVDTFEPQDSSTKTWVANTPGTTNAAISCTPTTATNPASTSHTITCQVNSSAGTGVTGQGSNGGGNNTVRELIQSGPDASNAAVLCTENLVGPNSQATGHYGVYSCTYTNNGVTGTDQIVAWLDNNHNSVVDSGEPAQSGITKTWVAPAPANATVTLVCSPNTTNAAGTACQDDPRSDKTATFTATVTNNNTSPASPASNVIVSFGVAQTGGPNDATDTESVSPTSCTTDASGKCSTVFTDSAPVDGETFQVTATVARASGGPVSASATKTFHTPTATEARNITVTPATATQPSGGSQDFVSKVTDRFGNPVPGVCVGFNESGPGHIVGGTGSTGLCQFVTAGTYSLVCVTGSAGTCGVTVVSQATETGAETVTATIDANNYNGGAGGGFEECTAPAGVTFATGTPSSTVTPPGGATAPGAAAGNCSANGSVTWKTQAPPPPPHKTRITASIGCHVPVHHRHRLRCRVQENPVRSGLRVKFKRRVNGHKAFLGSDFTNNHGRAHLFLTHLKKGHTYRVFAHVYATTRTTGATTNTVRIRIH